MRKSNESLTFNGDNEIITLETGKKVTPRDPLRDLKTKIFVCEETENRKKSALITKKH